MTPTGLKYVILINSYISDLVSHQQSVPSSLSSKSNLLRVCSALCCWTWSSTNRISALPVVPSPLGQYFREIAQLEEGDRTHAFLFTFPVLITIATLPHSSSSNPFLWPLSHSIYGYFDVGRTEAATPFSWCCYSPLWRFVSQCPRVPPLRPKTPRRVKQYLLLSVLAPWGPSSKLLSFHHSTLIALPSQSQAW